MKRFRVLTVLSMLLAASAVAAVVLTSTASAHACGAKGEKLCPLQSWMEDNIQVPMEKKDFKKLEAAFAKLAKMAPDAKWNDGDKGWSKIADAGAAAAKASDFKAVRSTCKSCHKAWRKQYRKEHRQKPVK